jgi:putative toxin-antitoxin system antitoxin component (TIGR02293 family)
MAYDLGHMTATIRVTRHRLASVPSTHGGEHERLSAVMKALIILIANDSENQLIHNIEQGISSKVIRYLPNYLSISQSLLAELIDVTPRTLHRWTSADAPIHLSVGAGERTVRLIALRERATAVFEDADEGLAWLNEPNDHFDGSTPLERAKTDIGYHQVTRLLTRIEQGVYS